ncbi:MAG: S-layer homology domain-containing protein [Bacillota bacterium]
MRKHLVTATLTVALVLSFSPSVTCAKDPAYVDISGHWANRYITTLWEEDITNGYLYSYWVVVNGRYQRRTIAYYFPDSSVTRAQYVTMLAKTFRLEPMWDVSPTFKDVPTDYALFGQTPAFGYIEAAASKQIALGDGSGRFKPDSATSREQAIALLCRSLGLTPYAQSMSSSDVDRILSFFKDEHKISSSFRQIVAAAVRLKIVEGYPDRTLRPQANLTRAEAATLLYRSCMLQLEANPSEFSPDGDGFEDITQIKVTYLQNRNYTRWTIWIVDSSGGTVTTLSQGSGHYPPSILTWDGRGALGPVADGVYFLKGEATDITGQVFSCPASAVYVLRNTLSALVQPLVAAPGESFRLLATTASHANAVFARARFQSATVEVPLRRTNPTTWTGTVTVPLNEPDGDVTIEFQAQYPKVLKNNSTKVAVFEPLIISGSVVPNPAEAGKMVQLQARCNEAAIRAWAIMPTGETVTLVKGTAQGVWEGIWTIPMNTPPGQYPVVFWAASRNKTASSDVALVVEGNVLEDILFTLTE